MAKLQGGTTVAGDLTVSGNTYTSTPTSGDNSTKAATTEFVRNSLTVFLNTFIGHTNQSINGIDTIPRMMASITSQLVSGTAYFTMFTPLYDLTVSQITVSSGTASAPSGVSLIKYGLYTWNETTKVATLVAKTANDITVLASGNVVYTRSFDTTGGWPATYTLNAGQRYAVASLAIATTTPNMFGMYPGSNLLQLTPIMSKSLTGQSDLPVSATLTTAGGQTYFSRLS